ncbi:hypothetical protein [Chryseobacterium gambrini]|uniref:hypothetical protein n=1 Tax=Chryseobacterium gambrini TaxID=373672 RepID=UPI0022F1B023|nr:hypothetical protein [Chryseobacterium gambrini]WBV52328.1 hypothetical protein PFY09_18745 [Chryseobacterium gambrini]
MKIELIPVIEITNYDNDIPLPPFGPYWEFSTEWEHYRIATNLDAGFSENLQSYSKGSSLYRISEIPDSDVLKIIQNKITTDENDDNLTIEDLISPLIGGYILKINDVDSYFPQCCGDLSNIEYWNNLFLDEDSFFYMGHPSPKIIKSENTIIFDFLNSPIQEGYAPPVSENQIEANKDLLKIAVENVKKELYDFARRLVKISETENLDIPEIDKLFVYGRIDD